MRHEEIPLEHLAHLYEILEAHGFSYEQQCLFRRCISGDASLDEIDLESWDVMARAITCVRVTYHGQTDAFRRDCRKVVCAALRDHARISYLLQDIWT